MASKKAGPPAFPNGTFQEGMSLRDWFAGQALEGLCAYPGREGESNKPEHFARWSYMLADAMLAARVK